MKKYIIWHDNDFDLALWVRDNSILRLKSVEYRCIPKTNSVQQIMHSFSDDITRAVLPFIRLETPDLIIEEINTDTYDTKVVCVAELMTHTPQWQHPAQRFSRIYNAVRLGAPSALFVPARKTKWEKGTQTSYRPTSYTCSPSVYRLFCLTSQQTNIPTLLFNWPDTDGYLRYDPKHPTSPHVSGDTRNFLSFLNTCISQSGNVTLNDTKDILELMNSKSCIADISQFSTIRGIVNTNEIIEQLKLDKTSLPESFLSTQETVWFAPSGLVDSNSAIRTDPYGGMLCAFDILFARDEYGNKIRNIVFDATEVDINSIDFKVLGHEYDNCPFDKGSDFSFNHLEHCPYTQPKYRRIYGEIADIVLFNNKYYQKDGETLYEYVN